MDKKRQIHIVYSTDDNYAFTTAVSVCSMMKYADAASIYCVHILIGEDLCDAAAALFEKLETTFSNLRVCFRKMDPALFDRAIVNCGYISLATMYRLILPELLKDVDRCIYIDGDTLVQFCVTEFLDIDLDNYYLAGVADKEVQKDSGHSSVIGISNLSTYVNAGVLLMNLSLMREEKMTSVFLADLDKGYPFNDQDILNKECFGCIKLLPKEYNVFSIYQYTAPKILHFAGDMVKPWVNLRVRYVDSWWSTASLFQNMELYDQTLETAKVWTKNLELGSLLGRCKESDSVFIWGFSEDGKRLCRALMKNRIENISGIIDSDSKKQGKIFCGIRVQNEGCLRKEKGRLLVINTVKYRRKQVSERMRKMGIKDENIFDYYPKTREYYMALDERYIIDEKIKSEEELYEE